VRTGHAQQDRARAPWQRQRLHEIFEANKDQLNDSDKIKPGQVLKIPTAA
jgi:nucleoid-associated protein YgaU